MLIKLIKIIKVLLASDQERASSSGSLLMLKLRGTIFLKAKTTQTIITSILIKGQLDLATSILADHSSYFRPNMTIFIYTFISYFSLCLACISIDYFS